ncbi:hypothetical protein KR018_002358 [Drosophila ironensis]|nr:hypothetical protein KR018_002358 [Drosophila ironensis]
MESERNVNSDMQYQCQCHSLVDAPEQQLELPKPADWTQPSQRRTLTSMSVFTTMMLHAWRQRREEVQQLQNILSELQSRSMKSKNRLHVCDTLIRVERKRNKELQLQLNESTMSLGQMRSSCETLTSTVHNLTNDRIQLREDLDQKYKEYDALEELSEQNKKQLFGALVEQRKLHQELCSHQRMAQSLKSENEQLISEVVMLEGREAKLKKMEDQYRTDIARKDDLIKSMSEEIASYAQKNQMLQEVSRELEEFRENNKNMDAQIKELLEKIKGLESKLQELSVTSVVSAPALPTVAQENALPMVAQEDALPMVAQADNQLLRSHNSKYWLCFRRLSNRVFCIFWAFMMPIWPVSDHPLL